MPQDFIHIEGARVNNLRNISLDIPHNCLCVITGLSGSGKSSLAFNTLYAEGQRRYLETLSSYARQFIGNLERPDVDLITGLNPIIAIEQKVTAKNPRSTVGTVTEIYDFLRLLYARASVAYSPVSGLEMIRYSLPQLVQLIQDKYEGRKCLLLAPLVKGRKGHYKELLEQIRKQGFIEARIDGQIVELHPNMRLDRYKPHFIEMVVDKIIPRARDSSRLRESVQSALHYGKESCSVLDADTGEIRYFSRNLMCPQSGISFPEPAPFTFSFNSPQGACPLCKGMGFINQADLKKIIPDNGKSIAEGGIEPLGKRRENMLFRQLEGLSKKFKFSLYAPIASLPQEVIDIILYGSDDYFVIESPAGEDFMTNFPGIVSRLDPCREHSEEIDVKKERFLEKAVCPECGGSRLKKESLCFKIDGQNIAQLNAMDIATLSRWFQNIESRLSKRQNAIAADIIKEIRDRLSFLMDVGLPYLSLDRSTRSLSGGESQRIRLATQIGSKLVNVLYILDEPSIGLHCKDNEKLIHSLQKLRDEGNTVIVVEHDEETIRHADYLVDLGPGAGRKGGRLLYAGEGKNFLSVPREGPTYAYLSGERRIEVPPQRRKGNGNVLAIKGAKGNNLKNIDVSFPLGCLICVTGVSGSGKSSLVNETLLPVLSRHLYHSLDQPLPYDSIEGISHIDKVVEVDQSPIGKTPRSNPATYTRVFTDIRYLFEATPDAKVRGFKANHFSFNIPGGRCEECKGAGEQLIEMNFLPDVHVPCRVCNKKRYKADTLAVRYKGKNIADVLDMTINQAVAFFEHIPSIAQKIKTLQDVGLGYIKLGQSSTTLSGGESQRVKLAAELAKRDTGETLYILDEPTTGLHMEDIRMLLDILQKLVNRGNTVIVIEHQSDIIKSADYLVDLGPEGGRDGGCVVACGTPEEVSRSDNSHTGRFLRKWLNNTARE